MAWKSALLTDSLWSPPDFWTICTAHIAIWTHCRIEACRFSAWSQENTTTGRVLSVGRTFCRAENPVSRPHSRWRSRKTGINFPGYCACNAVYSSINSSTVEVWVRKSLDLSILSERRVLPNSSSSRCIQTTRPSSEWARSGDSKIASLSGLYKTVCRSLCHIWHIILDSSEKCNNLTQFNPKIRKSFIFLFTLLLEIFTEVKVFVLKSLVQYRFSSFHERGMWVAFCFSTFPLFLSLSPTSSVPSYKIRGYPRLRSSHLTYNWYHTPLIR